MSNWIAERAAEVRKAEKERSDEFDRKTQAAAVLKTQLGPFWKELVEVLNQSVKDFNTEFPEVNRRIDSLERPDPETLTIRRNAYPAVLVKAQLNGPGTTVRYSISVTPRKGTNAVEQQASFSYTVIDGQVGYAEPTLRSHEDVAKLFFKEFFEF